MLHQNDLELARSAVAGDYAAFAKLYELYLPPVAAFARAQASDGREAADLATTTLKTVFAHLDGYRGRAPLAAFVLVIARRVAAQRRPAQAACSASRAAR
jgi:DNA-directed RNA polymerase specialized sigma24 family protein